MPSPKNSSLNPSRLTLGIVYGIPHYSLGLFTLYTFVGVGFHGANICSQESVSVYCICAFFCARATATLGHQWQVIIQIDSWARIVPYTTLFLASELDHNPISQTIPKNCVPIIPWRTYTYLPSFTFIHSIHIHTWLAETSLKCLSQPGSSPSSHQGPLVRSSIVMSFTATGVSPRVLASRPHVPSCLSATWDDP